jgi:environmental stress-induced protein Ves
MVDFPGIPWEALEEDITVKKSDPALTLENTKSASPYPQLNLKNPQRSWQLRSSEVGELLVFDALANASRLTIDVDGKLSSITSIAQDLLPDGNLTRSLGSSTLKWLLNGWNPDAHAGRHEYGGTDQIRNLDYLAIRGTTVIDGDRIFKEINKIQQGTLVFECPESGVWFPRFDIQNLDRSWRIIVAPTPGDLYLYDNTASVTRAIVRYNAAADSDQFDWRNSSGSVIMRIDYEGDVTISGKLTQGACPEFARMTLAEIKVFLEKCRDKPEPKKDKDGRDVCGVCGKPFGEGGCVSTEHWNSHVETHYHKTQEEVMALMHLVLNLMERVERLEAKLKGAQD